MNRRHEAAAGLVDQDRAFAAQGLGRQRRRIAADGDGRRMELDEFRIRDHRARPRRHAHAFAAGFGRIGRNGIERAEPAGREDHGRRAEQDQPRIAAHAVPREQSGDASVLHGQFDGVIALEDADRWRLERLQRQRARDLGARAVARDMDDAMGRMRGLAAQR